MNNRWTDAGSCSFCKDKLNLHSVSWDVAGSTAVLSSSGYHLQMDHQCWDALGPAPQESGCGLMLPPIPRKKGCSHSVKIPLSLFKMSDKPLLDFPRHAESFPSPHHPGLSQLFPLKRKYKHSDSEGRCFSVECTHLISWYVLV